MAVSDIQGSEGLPLSVSSLYCQYGDRKQQRHLLHTETCMNRATTVSYDDETWAVTSRPVPATWSIQAYNMDYMRQEPKGHLDCNHVVVQYRLECAESCIALACCRMTEQQPCISCQPISMRLGAAITQYCLC